MSLLNALTNTSFLGFLDIRPGDSVLEVGSGLGILAHRLATACPDSQVTGVEIAVEQLIKEAVAELDKLRENPYGSAYFYWNRAAAIKLDGYL